MNKHPSLALLLAASFFSANAEARRDIETFDDAIKATVSTAGRIDELQKEAEGPFLKVGPRCLNNWEKHKQEYERVIVKLKEVSKPAVEAIGTYEQAVKNLQEGSPYLKIGEACSDKAKVLEKDILKRVAEVKKLAKVLQKVEKDADQLYSSAYKELVTDAVEKDFSRGASCLFQYYYTDVALLALFRDYYPRGERAPEPALNKFRDDIHAAASFHASEEERLTKNLLRLNRLRMSCDAARDAGVTPEEEPEDRSENDDSDTGNPQ